MTAGPRAAAVDEGAAVDLARTLFADARNAVDGSPSFRARFDLALAALEFERALGEEHGARDAFVEGMALLRSAQGVEPWLFGGTAQAGWTAIQLARFHGQPLGGLGSLDELALRWIRQYPAERNVDLPMGLLGLGVYGLAHPSEDVREKLTNATLDTLASRVERDDDGLFLRLRPAVSTLAGPPVTQRDIGVAHGNAGLVSYLASAAASGLDCADRARSNLDDALAWLLKQRVDVDGAVFPQSVEHRYVPSRSAWCYGDPGVSLALSAAATVTGSAVVADLAKETAAAVLARAPERARIVDACLCHGAAGLCWFARRASDDFGLDADEFAAHWLAEISRQRAAGPLRYLSHEGMRRDESFLEGDIGVALALLYLGTGVRPRWEERMVTVVIGGEQP